MSCLFRGIGSANVRTWTENRPDTMARTLGHNAAVLVLEKVVGERWGPVVPGRRQRGQPNAPSGASYSSIRASCGRHVRSFTGRPDNPDRLPSRWFEADLLQPTLLTASRGWPSGLGLVALHGRAQPDVTPMGEHLVLYPVARLKR